MPDGDSDAIPRILPAGATIIASRQPWPAYLALDDGNVYWLNLGIWHSSGSKDSWWTGTQIMKCPKSGCPQGPTALVTGRLLTDGATLLNIATDGRYVYWSDDGPEESLGTTAIGIGLFRCAVAGCDDTPELLDGNRARGLAVAGGSLYVTHAYSAELEACSTSGCASPPDLLWFAEPWSANTETIAVAADRSDVFWTTRGIVMRCARTGCDNTPTILASSGNAVWMLGPIALDGTTVYFGHGTFHDGTQQRDGEILACAKTGCAGAPSLVATSAHGPASLATDGINVYWTERDSSPPYSSLDSHCVRKCAVAGCDDVPVTVVSGLDGHIDLAVDDTHLYFTDSGGRRDGSYGRIWRAPK